MLDINTPAGQETLKAEQRAYRIIQKHTPNVQFIQTPKELDGKIDGFSVRDGVLTGVFETKCRQVSVEQMMDWGSWLITNTKLEHLRRLSSVLRIPSFGYLYCRKDEAVMIWQITDDNGKYLFDFDVKRTKTRATVNGGVAFRKNAFLPVEEVTTVLHA